MLYFIDSHCLNAFSAEYFPKTKEFGETYGVLEIKEMFFLLEKIIYNNFEYVVKLLTLEGKIGYRIVSKKDLKTI